MNKHTPRLWFNLLETSLIILRSSRFSQNSEAKASANIEEMFPQ